MMNIRAGASHQVEKPKQKNLTLKESHIQR